MKNFIKIGNTKLKDITVSSSGENIIYAKDVKEEFFGIYNINIFGQSLLCPVNENNIATCSVVLDDVLYENVNFKIKKGNKNKIIVNTQHLEMPVEFYNEPAAPSTSNELLIENNVIDKGTSSDLLFLIEDLKNEILKIKESKAPEVKINYREIAQFIKETIDTESKNQNEKYKETIISNFFELFEKQESVFKDKVFNVSEGVSRDIVKKVINEYEDNFREEIFYITEENKNIVKREAEKLYDKVKLEVEDIVDEMLLRKEAILENLQKNFDNIAKDVVKSTYEQSNNVVKESSIKTDDIINTFKKNIEENILSNRDELKNIKEVAESAIEGIIAESNKRIDSLIANFDKDIKDRNKIIEEKLKKIEQSDKANKDITKQIIEQTKKYTDTKTQEAIRYARILLDYAGGGGTVAVQYANGGKIAGDLVVEGDLSAVNLNTGSISLSSGYLAGDLTVGGNITTYSSYLSGTAERNLLDIFAGEGPGDNNNLDGGIF